MKRSAIIPFAREEDPQMSYTGVPSVQFLPLSVPDSKRSWGSKECKNCDGFCKGHLVCLEKVLATDSNDLPVAHTYLPNNAIKESFVKAQKESRD